MADISWCYWKANSTAENVIYEPFLYVTVYITNICILSWIHPIPLHTVCISDSISTKQIQSTVKKKIQCDLTSRSYVLWKRNPLNNIPSLYWGELQLAINSFIPLRVKELKPNENINLALNVKILSSTSRKVFSMQWMNIFSSRYQTSQLSIQSHRENWIADYFPNLGILWHYWVSLRGENKWLIYLPKVKSTFPPDSLFTNSKSLMSIDGWNQLKRF